MWFRLLKFGLTYLLDRLIGLIWREYEKSKKEKEQIKIDKEKAKEKVKAIKNAKTKEEFRAAVRDLSI